MTIQECYNTIITAENSISQHSYDTDLENTVLKISQDSSGTYFTLESIFDQSASESICLNTDIIQLFTDRLSLLFSSGIEAGNVCFANNSEIRPEFRQSLTAIELLDYVYAFLHSSFYKEFHKIALMSEADVFWKMVKIGEGFRKRK